MSVSGRRPLIATPTTSFRSRDIAVRDRGCDGVPLVEARGRGGTA
jgi:hypothetical protein